MTTFARFRRIAVAAIAICTLFAAPLALHAQTKPKTPQPVAAPQSILWVGNSFFYYNNSIDRKSVV